ncbi:MAG: nuclear transport factor 2 family protein [Chitinispirillales bacterium]|jgi:hypothetical protein|nr:nuclear transport factor 2 family protein [Chitinispirillales bacterium]
MSFLIGCSVFDLKNPQAPSLDSSANDPLNIRDILMSVAHDVADDMDYGSYFTDDVTFTSFNFPPQGKDNILRMLERLRLQGSTVDWEVEKAQKIPEGNDQWIVKEMPYIVYSKDGEPISAGKADFRIVKNNGWMISQWKDMPENNANAFFEPY